MWLNAQFRADFVTFNEETLNGKLHFFAQYGFYMMGTLPLNGSLPLFYKNTVHKKHQGQISEILIMNFKNYTEAHSFQIIFFKWRTIKLTKDIQELQRRVFKYALMS